MLSEWLNESSWRVWVELSGRVLAGGWDLILFTAGKEGKEGSKESEGAGKD